MEQRGGGGKGKDGSKEIGKERERQNKEEMGGREKDVTKERGREGEKKG